MVFCALWFFPSLRCDAWTRGANNNNNNNNNVDEHEDDDNDDDDENRHRMKGEKPKVETQTSFTDKLATPQLAFFSHTIFGKYVGKGHLTNNLVQKTFCCN